MENPLGPTSNTPLTCNDVFPQLCMEKISGVSEFVSRIPAGHLEVCRQSAPRERFPQKPPGFPQVERTSSGCDQSTVPGPYRD